jgi:hypothetical protein
MQKWEAWSFLAMWQGGSLLPMVFLVGLVMATHGTAAWERIPGVVLANALVWLVVAVAPFVAYLVSRRRKGRFAAWMEKYLTSHSIAQARATIAEIEEFAGP